MARWRVVAVVEVALALVTMAFDLLLPTLVLLALAALSLAVRREGPSTLGFARVPTRDGWPSRSPASARPGASWGSGSSCRSSSA